MNSSSASSNADHGPEAAAHLPGGDLVAGMVGKARVAHAGDALVGGQELGDGQRVGATGAPAARRAWRASGAPARPRTGRGSRRCAPRHAASASASSGSAQAACPSTRSEWPVSDFVALDIEMSAPSSSGRWASGVASVLSTASSAPACVHVGGQRGRGRARRGPGWTAPRPTRASRRATPRGSPPRRSARAAPRRPSSRGAPRRRRARRGRRPTARRARRPPDSSSSSVRGDRGHARREDDGRAALEVRQRGLVVRPRRVAVAVVAVAVRVGVAGQVVRPGERGAGEERLALRGAGSPACTARVPVP